MEWPGQDPADALTSTLNAITDFYRIKLAGGTKGARATIARIGNAITAAKNGKAIRVGVRAARRKSPVEERGRRLEGFHCADPAVCAGVAPEGVDRLDVEFVPVPAVTFDG
jgi:DNA helicase-2/ATP-dependent DNA helicase PcrA